MFPFLDLPQDKWKELADTIESEVHQQSRLFVTDAQIEKLARHYAKVIVREKLNKESERAASDNVPDRLSADYQSVDVNSVKGKKYYYLRVTDKQMRIAKRRIYEQSDSFKDRYRWRAGVEATMSEYDRRTGVKHLRVRGLKAVKFCANLKALGVSIFRAAAFRASKMMPVVSLCEA